MSAVTHAGELLEEARATNERRVVVLAGERERVYPLADHLLETIPVGIAETVAISSRPEWTCRRVEPSRSTEVMGRTFGAVVLDLFDGASPNVIGRATGAVDGGGLLIWLCPPLASWPAERDAFDRRLVVKPFTLGEVTGNFRRHLRTTLRSHPGIAIVDANADRVQRSGLTGDDPAGRPSFDGAPPAGHRFPVEAYRACASRDQTSALRAFETLLESPTAVVVSAERGRGKTAAAGLGAAALAAEGFEVGITAPAVENVGAAFTHGAELATSIGATVEPDEPARIHTADGSVSFRPIDVLEPGTYPDVLFVDEAAGIPVPRLETLLEVDRLALTTTRHGYEGSGQGFATRFRDLLDESHHQLVEREMRTPIRYGSGDPIEPWLNRALWLDARPAHASALPDRDATDLEYRRWDGDELIASHEPFRQVMGLLSSAHYRTEPDDVARILDAPNLDLRTLDEDGMIVSVVLVAREGGLADEDLNRAYRGARLRGNMLPDIFINEFREPELAGRPGLRIVRIATHPAERRQGYASALLGHVEAEFGRDIRWWGAGFGVTPGLVRFWSANGFVPIFLGASRNRASGVHSIGMLHRSVERPAECFAAAFPRRLRGSLLDAHRALDAETVLAIFEAIPEGPPLSIRETEWRSLAAAAHGAGRYDLDPEPGRRLAVHHLARAGDDPELPEGAATLLVKKVLQGRSWDHVAGTLGYHSVGQAKRALGEALAVLVDHYGGSTVADERARLEGEP